jgi:hypothetical protein
MFINTKLKFTILALAIAGLAVSCKKKDDDEPTPTTSFRGSFDYSKLADKTPYDSLFVDATGAKTVDLTDGNNRIKMFTELNSHISNRVNNANNRELSLDTLKKLFSNTGSVFIDATLNASSVNIRQVTGSSKANADVVRGQIEGYFAGIEIASDSVLKTAASNKAGKITAANGTSKYLLDSNGVELIQIIQKGLIGSFQYDYIGNVLLGEASLSADNSKLVTGKLYTQLEHNWDEAFATLTLNKVYGITATDLSSGSERFIGSYAREYGNSAYGNDFLKLHPAFLKGRAAIVNNDITEVKAQATIIRTILEKVMARAAMGYLKKWKDNKTLDPGAAMHQIGEGLGFVYSLRFCTLHGADDAFSAGLLNDLIYSHANGIWDLTPEQATAASDKIKAKFGL